MKITGYLLAILFFWATSAAASPSLLYVSKSGNDKNDCASLSTPCLTIQAAVDKVPFGSEADISVGPGVYAEAVNVYYWRAITIHGPALCSEADASTVVVGLPGGTAITSQDHAIVGVSCLTVRGATGLFSRQLAILDYFSVRFLANTAVSLNSNSIASCSEIIWVRSGGTSVFLATSGSVLNVSCNVQVSDGLSFTAFIIVGDRAIGNLGGAAVVASINGQQWIVSNGTLQTPASPYVIPGSGTTELSGAVVY